MEIKQQTEQGSGKISGPENAGFGSHGKAETERCRRETKQQIPERVPLPPPDGPHEVV